MTIKICEINIYEVELPLIKPYRISGGRLFVDKMDSIIVAITTSDGIVGWGESCPFGISYLPAFAGGIKAGMAQLAPILIGANPLELENINHLMDLTLKGHLYIKSAIDVACWDILGKYANLPLYTLLGGRFSEHADLIGAFANGTPEEMVADLKQRRDQGYHIFSPKIGGEVSLDMARIQAIMAELQPQEKITIDANRAWLPDHAIQIMNSINDKTVYFEQPCETLEECLTVRRLTQHPIILDECIHTFQDLLWAQREGVAQAINIKIGRVGGLTKARQMRDFCLATGLRMNIEETGGSVIGGTGAIHLAVATPLRYRLATSDSTRLHTVIPAKGGYTYKKGTGIPPETPGLGIEPIMEILGEPIAVYTKS
ncbi:MAG: mandelate racemase/muconate lactonizing enzyme family protein [Okeania sp. SIO2F4]|uniref:mandelate racemase/muconate lactonizing enzyme family protein n=1 Tax=Okeania sp. SIO2F4 TaxID=2607790 RepID=UPI00142B56F9|nr:mandelate racemase/muconate lactonizing enzyme family protein [Okeania sp. SIO2F4]NES07435.1 mandelate racemase/muconate lactonizing enzyme family protein [Okeania sp. SIO2F4]